MYPNNPYSTSSCELLPMQLITVSAAMHAVANKKYYNVYISLKCNYN